MRIYCCSKIKRCLLSLETRTHAGGTELIFARSYRREKRSMRERTPSWHCRRVERSSRSAVCSLGERQTRRLFLPVDCFPRFKLVTIMGKGAFDEIGSTRVTLRWFSMMVLSSQVVGVLAIILLAILFGQYRGGFGWTVSRRRQSALAFSTDHLSAGYRKRIQLSSAVHDAGHGLLLRRWLVSDLLLDVVIRCSSSHPRLPRVS